MNNQREVDLCFLPVALGYTIEQFSRNDRQLLYSFLKTPSKGNSYLLRQAMNIMLETVATPVGAVNMQFRVS